MADDKTTVDANGGRYVEWHIADTAHPDPGGVVQLQEGNFDYMPAPGGSKPLAYPETETPENQSDPDDLPNIQGWTYIPDPIEPHPKLPGPPMSAPLYLHARVSKKGLLQFGLFAFEEKDPDGEMEWELAHVVDFSGAIDKLAATKDIVHRLTIAPADEVEGFLVIKDASGEYRLNEAVDPRLIGPLAPCSIVNIWDSCGGGGEALCYGHCHSIWGCIHDNVLYMHVFKHEVGDGTYVGWGKLDDKSAKDLGTDCGCVRVPVDLPCNTFDECPVFDGCPPSPCEPHVNCGYHFNMCCGYEIIAHSKNVAGMIGVVNEPMPELERDMAETDSNLGPCAIRQNNSGDVYARYGLLTRHGGVYNGKWVVTQRVDVCECQDDGKPPTVAPVPADYPYLAPVDCGEWAVPGAQDYGPNWPNIIDRRKDAESGVSGIMYGECGQTFISTMRSNNVYEMNTGHAPEYCYDIFVDMECCERGSDSGTGSDSGSDSDSKSDTGSESQSDTGSESQSGTGSESCDAYIQTGEWPTNTVCKKPPDTVVFIGIMVWEDGALVAQDDMPLETPVPVVPALQTLLEHTSSGQYVDAIYSYSTGAEVVLVSREAGLTPGKYEIEVYYSCNVAIQIDVLIPQVPLDHCGPYEPYRPILKNSYKAVKAAPVIYAETVGYAPFVAIDNFTYSVTIYNGDAVVDEFSPEPVMQGIAGMAADITERTSGRYVLGVSDGLLRASSTDLDWAIAITAYSAKDGHVLQNILIRPE